MQNSRLSRKKISAVASAILLVVAFVVTLAGSAVLAYTPSSMRTPSIEHLHFRMQIVVDGQYVDASDERFQVPYVPNLCSGDLTAEPIHFHDGNGQFVHIHWKAVTGGQVLKNYGWNYIGGDDAVLGYRFDDLFNIRPVPIHGDVLPTLDPSTNLYIYTGDENSYARQDFAVFMKEPLETFFGRESNFLASGDSHSDAAGISQLERINNLLGNVVIFAQDEEPTQAAIEARFDALVPLTESTCGG